MNIPSASIYRDLCPLNQGPTMVGKFIDYMLDFYGVNGVYPYAVTEKEIEKALGLRLKRFDWIPFDGDTLDREHCFEIIMELRGHK